MHVLVKMMCMQVDDLVQTRGKRHFVLYLHCLSWRFRAVCSSAALTPPCCLIRGSRASKSNSAHVPIFTSKHAVQGTFDDRMLNALQGEAQAGDWEEQLKQMNMTPEDVIGKIMSEPTLAKVGTKHLQTWYASLTSALGLLLGPCVSMLPCATCYVSYSFECAGVILGGLALSFPQVHN